jgi:hypothetical protein
MSYIEIWRNRANSALPYISTLFYVEILLIFIFLNFLYGKPFALAVGLLLIALLTLHVIMLFNENPVNRKIQLLLMDLHVAWSVAFVVIHIAPGLHLSFFDMAAAVFRAFAAAVELPVIFLVTSEVSGQ